MSNPGGVERCLKYSFEYTERKKLFFPGKIVVRESFMDPITEEKIENTLKLKLATFSS